MLYLIGLGLSGESSLTLEGLKALKDSDLVFLENYTGILPELNVKKLEELITKKVVKLKRGDLEDNEDVLIKNKTVSILFQGDPLSATTHHELLLRAKEKKIKTKVIHNASIITSVSESGLQLYKFGRIISIPFWSDSFKPDSYLKFLEENLSNGLHTLCLFDLNPEKNTFLSVKEALKRVLVSKKINLKTKVVICSQLGAKNQKIVYDTVKSLEDEVFREPACMIIPGVLHFFEEEFLVKL